ncbi:hypothetical protein DC498_04595 [Terrimonas sp.]|uniref:hypothetical protein n=1 Tax=Terrimonas sp. TaxID=1914338 RepID=UPI000D5064A8|nr:hypothetical protein [Terrimonas sp.]PVD53793.1 hypothetical protein DC498_04595 [Terrimonas sp.]
MLRQLNLILESPLHKCEGTPPIKYNLQKRLAQLRYIDYAKIEVLLGSQGKHLHIEWEDKRSIIVYCEIDPSSISNLSTKSELEYLYSRLKEVFIAIWQKRSWPILDLVEIFKAIEESEYESTLYYGKYIMSPSRNFKAELYCELFPVYTNYYVVFHKKDNMLFQKIFFLKGISDPSLFFDYFQRRHWISEETFVISDLKNEMLYQFNVTSSDFSVVINPSSNSVEECENILKAFRFDIPPNERLKLLGL